MNKTIRQQYDCIISLGGCCSAASQLKLRGLRPVSLPFDWTLMRDDRPIRYLPKGLRNRFCDFCLRENMVEFEKPGREHGRLRYRLEDLNTGFCFIHHFEAPPSDENSFLKVKAVLDRRMARFFETIEKSNDVLLVLTTPFAFDPKLLEEIVVALREVFPRTNVELCVMMFSAGENKSWDSYEDALHVSLHTREVNTVYDNSLTSIEWAWLDSLVLGGRPSSRELRRSNLLLKWKYKLWKNLGKSLQRAGVACASLNLEERR